MPNRQGQSDSNRSHGRSPLIAEVSVELQAEPIVGSGRNISEAGVFFISDQEIRATVRIGDKELRGVLVRIENHGKGHTGVAVRFDEPRLD